ncbi:MAG: BtpA/SgcQ family protein, partial [bacterium]|nr:BtpA/SgcQ family protein [bacterium]
MRNLPPKAIIGMIHTLALPGSPYYGGDIKSVINRAIEDLKIYEEAGIGAVMLENMYDLPYVKPPLSRSTVGGMLRVAQELRSRTKLPIGIQMLEVANLEALEIAARADLDFIRVENFVFVHVGPVGLVEGSAGALF